MASPPRRRGRRAADPPEPWDENIPQHAIIPGLYCSKVKAHPIRKCDEKRDGTYFNRCSFCRARDVVQASERKAKALLDVDDPKDATMAEALHEDGPEDANSAAAFNEDDPQNVIIPGLYCSRVKEHPIRKCDERENRPGTYWTTCSRCRELGRRHYKAARMKGSVQRPVSKDAILPHAILNELYRTQFNDRTTLEPTPEPSSQPNLPTENLQSLSQPSAITSTLRASSPVKRYRTDPDVGVHTHFALLRPLQRRVLDVIQSRMNNAGINTRGLTAESLEWCLPQS
jgi:hypothetical protein